MEDQYDTFFKFCAIIPQHPNDGYWRKTFSQGLHAKLKKTLIGMPRVTLVQMANSTIVFEDKLLVKRKNMVKHDKIQTLINMKRIQMKKVIEKKKEKKAFLRHIKKECFAKIVTMFTLPKIANF